MKTGAPWSIKGIDPEAREAAKLAAAKVGMTLGDYFNHLLLEANPASLVSGDEGPGAGSQRMSASSEAMGSGPADEVTDLAERIQNSESRTAKDMSDIRQSVSDMSKQMSALVDRQDETPEIETSALEDLNYRIEENQQRNEKAIADTQTTLSEISERIEASINSNNEAVTTVGKAIEVMAARLDTLESKDDQPQLASDQSISSDENIQFGSRHEPEEAEAELIEELEHSTEAKAEFDEALNADDVEETAFDTDELADPEESAAETLEKILQEEQSVDEVGPDTTEDGLMDISEMSADELLASFDDIPDLSDQSSEPDLSDQSSEPDLSDQPSEPDLSDQPSEPDLSDQPSEEEEAVQADSEDQSALTNDELLADTDDTPDIPEDSLETEATLQTDDEDPLENILEAAGLDEDPEITSTEPGRATSIDDFLNQFGGEPLATPEPEAPQETQTDADDVAATNQLPVLEEYVPEDESDIDEADGKSAQDVIEAIRKAARNTSGIAEENDDEDDSVEPASLAESAANSNSGSSSRVKYAIYAACSAILLAASGLIASVKGLI